MSVLSTGAFIAATSIILLSYSAIVSGDVGAFNAGIWGAVCALMVPFGVWLERRKDKEGGRISTIRKEEKP